MTTTCERRMALLALLVVTLFLPSEVTSENHIRPLVIQEPQKEFKNLPITNEVSRVLHYSKSSKSKSSKEPPKLRRLEAELKSKHSDYDDLDGYVKIRFNTNDGNNEDRMRIEYQISDGPESCDECYVAIVKAKSCRKRILKDADLFYKDGDDNPWNLDDSGFTTGGNGDASGTLFGLKSGKDGSSTHCRAAVIYGPRIPESSSSSSKSSKSYKSYKSSKSYSRKLHDDDHHHHHHHDDDDDDDDDDDIVIIGCGILHKVGKRDDC